MFNSREIIFLQFMTRRSKYAFAILLFILHAGCGFKRIGSHYFDSRCHRDLPGIWWGESCPVAAAELASEAGEGPDPIENGERPCALAINPSLCIDDGIEHSVWRSEARQAAIALSYHLTLQSYYEFQMDGRYTHYLVLTHPFLSKRYYEKREGTIQLEKNDVIDSIFYSHTLDFHLQASSCSGGSSPSLFELFDESNQSQIARKDYQISLMFPDIDFEIEIRNFGDLIAAFILEFSELFFEVMLAPLTPNFWKEVVTGPLHWETGNQEDLAQLLASSEELCFSNDGFQTLIPHLNVPPEVQFILLSQ